VTGLIIDSFAGGGGASTGILWATGRHPDLAVNHNAEALAIHAANHPTTRHLIEDVWDVDPLEATGGKPVELMWASPDCTFFSKARGAKPHRDRNRAGRRRGLAHVVVRWARAVRPRVICLENVEEFRRWGPLGADGLPDPKKVGVSYAFWRKQLERLGYVVEERELRACDFGAPTIRKRLFIIARCDGQPIVWPTPTHGPGLLPYRTAAECIDWTIPAPSIFDRKRPLAPATLKRIARGIQKFVLGKAKPFVVPLTHHGKRRGHPIDEPMPTVTGANRGELAAITPYLTECANASNPRVFAADEPLRTQCANVKGGHHAVVAPYLVSTRNGEREGQAPRTRSVEDPAPTITVGGSHGGLSAPVLVKYYGNEREGHGVDEPIGAVTTRDRFGLADVKMAFLARNFGRAGTPGNSVAGPVGTLTAKDHTSPVVLDGVRVPGQMDLFREARPPRPVVDTGRAAEVRAFLAAHGIESDGLVTIDGETFQIVDIGMRMLNPRELFTAQGFPADYAIEVTVKLKRLTKTAQVKAVGNSVCPHVAAAIVAAQIGARAREAA
jgi:DNA (cytosine-5)-methyltransferase 1